MAGQSEVVHEAILEEKIADMWPKYPCLYDVRSTEFRTRFLRDKAYHEMAEELQKSTDWVKGKLRSLRNSYTKVKKPGSNRRARKVLNKRASWLLLKLKFLDPYIATRSSLSDNDFESFSSPTTKHSGHEAVTDTPSSLSQSEPDETVHFEEEPFELKSNRKRQAEEEFNTANGLTDFNAERMPKAQGLGRPIASTVETFCQYIAQSLCELDSKTCYLAQHRISEVLFQAQNGTLAEENPYMPPLRPRPQYASNTQHSLESIHNKTVNTYAQCYPIPTSTADNDNNSNAPAGNGALKI